jgi:hypothetical protein
MHATILNRTAQPIPLPPPGWVTGSPGRSRCQANAPSSSSAPSATNDATR